LVGFTYLSTAICGNSRKGYVVFTTLTPSTVEISSGIIYPGLDYEGIGHASNGTILFTYEWARTSGLPWGLISFNALEDILVYSLSRIPKSKISIGVPTIGYVLQLPYIECVSRRYSISYTSAVNLAIEHDSTIYYDESTLASFFTFSDNSNDFMVWFKDARSVYSIVSLVPEYNLEGIGIWNIMQYFPQLWLIINSMFIIDKVL
jgi:spore germination protein